MNMGSPDANGRPRQRWFSGPGCLVILLLLGVGGSMMALAIRKSHQISCGRRNVIGTLGDLQRALKAYRADFGTFPVGAATPLVADTRVFVQAIKGKYYNFRDEDIHGGEYVLIGEPFCYSFPVKEVPGPDGKSHEGVDYYLWTWDPLGSGPAAAWGINNWSPLSGK